MPLLTVRHSATGTARFTYTYNNKSYTGSVSMRISALMNDANNYFSKIEGVSMTDFKNGGSGASFNSLTMGHVSMHYETSVVNVTLKFSLYGTSFYKNWAAGMSNSSSTLKLTPIP